MKRLVVTLFAVLMLLASPAMAAEPVTTLPEVRSFESARMDLAITINEDVLIYAKAEFAGTSLHAVAVDVTGQQVIEIIVIENRVYLRTNTDTRWQATTVDLDDPGDIGVPVEIDLTDLEEFINIYDLGTVNVRGVPTTQYQAQIDPALLGAPNDPSNAFNLNAFIGQSDSFLRKFQATIVASFPDTGDVLIQTPLDVYDFNQPIVIGAPAPELVDEFSNLASIERTDLPGTNILPFWMRPFEEYSLKATGYIK